MSLPGLLTIGLVQISEQRFRHYYFPYSVGLLQAYVQAHARKPERYQFLLPIFQRLGIPQALQALSGADIAGFSCYVWNEQRSLAIAQALKLEKPQTLILFGGPQVPDQSEPYLRKYPFIDLCVHGAGEQTFLQILESWPDTDWTGIAGISWLDTQGRYHQNPPGPRLKNLDQIPSPYLSGIFDQLMAAFPGMEWIGTWETNRGCPFSCTFCDWGSLTASKVYRFELERLQAEIHWFGSRRIGDVFTADANFGIFPRDVELARAFAQVKAKYGYPRCLQTQTAKNVKQRNFEIQQILAEAGLAPVTAISLQSTSPQVLQAIQRENISQTTYQEIQKFCLDQGIYSYTDIILGLPEESYDSFTQTVDDILQQGQYNKVIFYNAALLPNAAMSQAAYRQRYGLETIHISLPGHAPAGDGITEWLEIIIASRSFSREDWIRMHVFAWMSNFLVYTHKLLQLPLLALHRETGLSWKRLIESFCEASALSAYPLLQAIAQALRITAHKLQQGITDPVENPLWFACEDGVQLSPDLLLQIRLNQEGNLSRFFEEAQARLQQLLREENLAYPLDLLTESIQLSQAIFASLFYGQVLTGPAPPGVPRPEQLSLKYPLRAFFQACLSGQKAHLLSDLKH